MTPANLSLALEVMVRLRRPAFIWGPPGVGKSDLVADIAKRMGIKLLDFRMALRDPTDIKGFPMPDQATSTMKFFRDGELPTKGKGILFMDELVSATPATQAAGMQLCLPPFRIGDYQLPEGWSIIAAGNRETDRAVVHRMPTALANRFTHFDYEVNAGDWVQWALNNGVSAELIAWIRFKENMLFSFDPKTNDRAFATPRSWAATEDIVKSALPDTVKYETIKGTVGEGPGSEYWGFRKLIKDLPTMDEIRKDPKKTKVPEEPATLYALTTTMAMNTKQISHFDTFMDYVTRFQKEFQAVYVRDCLRKDKTIATSSTFTKWALANKEVIL